MIASLLGSFENSKLVQLVADQRYRILDSCYLKEEDPQIKIPPFQSVLSNSKSKLKKEDNIHWSLHTEYKKLRGKTDIFLHGDFDSDKKSVVFHHGAGQTTSEAFLVIRMLEWLFADFNLFTIIGHHAIYFTFNICCLGINCTSKPLLEHRF